MIHTIVFMSPEGRGGVFESKGDKDKKSEDAIFDTGAVSVAVPCGWKAFTGIDVHSQRPGDENKHSVIVCKGDAAGFEIFRKPYVKLDHRGDGIYLAPPMKSFYDNVVDIAPIKLGDRVWEGFSCDSMGYPLVMLYLDEGDEQFQVIISCTREEGAISLEDDEVKRIIASFKVC